MVKLLIVDDECTITDLLSEYLQNRLEGEAEILKAYTSKSAAEIMGNMRIDILLTDINMPGMNGLELHRVAMQAYPYCKVIFLTGHHDIKNVQYALRNESVDFILKTEENEVIVNSIHRAISVLENEISAEKLLARAQEQLRYTRPIIHEKLMLELLNGGTFDRASFDEVEFPLHTNERVLLLLGRIDNNDSITSNTRHRLKNLTHSVISEARLAFSVMEDYDILWLIQPQHESEDKTKEAVQSCMDDVQQICRRVFNLSISLALAQNFVPFTEILPTWLALKQTIKSLHGLSDGMLLIENNLNQENRDTSTEWLYVKNILQNIQISVDNLKREQYEQQYQKLSAYLQKNALSPARKMEAFMRLYLVFLANDTGTGSDTDVNPAWRLSNCEGWESYDRAFRSIADAFFSRQNQSSFQNTNQVLREVKNYIEANLKGDLSLKHLAKIANFSPSYLSRLFKQVTNISLSEYIGQLKCKHAKRLLSDGSMKIADIATGLGFDTPSYFTRFFKKYEGVGPQEYRDMCRAKKDNMSKKISDPQLVYKNDHKKV